MCDINPTMKAGTEAQSSKGGASSSGHTVRGVMSERDLNLSRRRQQSVDSMHAGTGSTLFTI